MTGAAAGRVAEEAEVNLGCARCGHDEFSHVRLPGFPVCCWECFDDALMDEFEDDGSIHAFEPSGYEVLP